MPATGRVSRSDRGVASGSPLNARGTRPPSVGPWDFPGRTGRLPVGRLAIAAPPGRVAGGGHGARRRPGSPPPTAVLPLIGAAWSGSRLGLPSVTGHAVASPDGVLTTSPDRGIRWSVRVVAGMTEQGMTFRALADMVRVGAAVSAMAALVGIPSLGLGTRFLLVLLVLMIPRATGGVSGPTRPRIHRDAVGRRLDVDRGLVPRDPDRMARARGCGRSHGGRPPSRAGPGRSSTGARRAEPGRAGRRGRADRGHRGGGRRGVGGLPLVGARSSWPSLLTPRRTWSSTYSATRSARWSPGSPSPPCIAQGAHRPQAS